MPITLVCSYLLNLGINSLLEQGSLILILSLFIILPLSMLGLPLLAFWCLNNRYAPATTKLAQQFLRASAGPDELLVRELSNMKSKTNGIPNHDQIEPKEH